MNLAVQVPATSANLGPGFDVFDHLSKKLKLYQSLS